MKHLPNLGHSILVGNEFAAFELFARKDDGFSQLGLFAHHVPGVPCILEIGDIHHYGRGASVLRDEDRAVGPTGPCHAVCKGLPTFGIRNDILIKARAL